MLIPMHQLARLIHEERIQAAQARRPEWTYAALPRTRPEQALGSKRHVRRWVAQTLRRLAARVEPSGTRWQTPSVGQRPASTQ
jgi:hypothetical protein